METTYRWRCRVGRGWSLSRCLDPAWTSCTAIFKEDESQWYSRGHGVEMRHTVGDRLFFYHGDYEIISAALETSVV